MDRPVFHAGEVAMQRLVGADARLHEIGPRVIRSEMPDPHREFFEQLPTLLVGSVDDRGRPWASLLAALPGFIESPDARHLRVDASPVPGDPLRAQLRVGASLGLLGLEPQTRRRNRANGRVEAVDDGGFTLAIEQSFGNCPKYIQARAPQWVGWPDAVPCAVDEGATLSPGSAALVAAADTLFIASSAPDGSVDVSHRGGRPGFVRVEHGPAGTVLTLPDFSGNFFFNTLGNLLVNPRAGLLFVEHDGGGMLQLTGRTEIVADGPELRAFAGAQRLLRVEIEAARWTAGALPLRWSAPVFAPQLETTGTW